MRSTTLFSLYATALVVLMFCLGIITLYSLERARWWDNRIQLAQESHSLHLRLEADIFRLFKQHGDALLIGDRDRGAGERDLSQRIENNLAAIRNVIAREIDLVGDEEVEELAVLNEIEAGIGRVNAAIATFTSSGEPIDTEDQITRLADLLDRKIDIQLTQLIEAALAEELEEVEETLADAATFRAWNQRAVYGLLFIAMFLIATGFVSFNRQIRMPLIALMDALSRLRKADYKAPVKLSGSREFRDLGNVLGEMAAGLSAREAGREEQRQTLEATVERRTAELQQLIDRLEIGEENRKRLMADISHELRTPLTIILGEAEVALRKADRLTDETADALARIRDSARHTNQIVDDMLTIARHEAGQLRLDRKKHDLRKVLHDAVEMFPQNIALNMPGKPALMSIDAVRLRQSILALFHNARRHGGPSITASLSAKPTGFQIIVADDGPGLGQTEKEHAFDRFFRGSNASGQGIEGSGLGLPVVRSIVEAHGGQVTLADAELGGLAVQIDLPARATLRPVRDISARKSA